MRNYLITETQTNGETFEAFAETLEEAVLLSDWLQKTSADAIALKIEKISDNKILITENENELLNEIIESEIDGVGMGYSEFDGFGISNEEKGTLSSLIKKGLVYNSFEHDNEINSMYCTTDLRNNIQVI